jgi:hypothetical protein
MTREEIIRMAREAGYPDYAMGLASEDAWQKTERFAALVAAHEREECAKVCEDAISSYVTDSGGMRLVTLALAAAIRSRGEVKP